MRPYLDINVRALHTVPICRPGEFSYRLVLVHKDDSGNSQGGAAGKFLMAVLAQGKSYWFFAVAPLPSSSKERKCCEMFLFFALF